MNIYTSSFLTLLLLINSGASSAQNFELNSIVVTGTRTAKLLQDSPVDMQVVTGQQIQMLGSGTLAQSLNLVPGVVITRSAKKGYNVQMQGFDGDHVLVLVNGQRLISPSGTRTDLDQINALDVERIEVLKGAASVMYGSAAMGGVLNIITKNQSVDKTRIQYETSSFNSNALSNDPLGHRLALSTGKQTPILSSKLSYQNIYTPGFKYDNYSQEEDGTTSDKHFLDLAFKGKTLLGEFNYQGQYFLDNKDRKENDNIIPGLGTVSNAYASKTERNSHAFTLQHAQNWKSQLKYAQHKEESGTTNRVQRSANMELSGVESQYVWFAPWGELVSGLQLDNESMNIPNDGIVNKHSSTQQFFMQNDWLVSNEVELLTGFRVQHDSGFGWHKAARASALIKQPIFSGQQLDWRFGVGQSYRVPSLKEQHYILDHSSMGYVVIGNEKLQPEKTLSYNLSVSLNTLSDQTLSLSVHQSHSDDFIENIFSDAYSQDWGVDAYVYQNIAKVTIKGGEIQYKLPIYYKHQLQFNYAYVEARDENKQRLKERPRHLVKASWQTQFNWLETQILSYAVYQGDEAYTLRDGSGSTTEDSYIGTNNNAWLSLNVSVTQQPTRNLKLSYGIENILDEHKDTQVSDDLFDAREEDSRRVYMGMTYQF